MKNRRFILIKIATLQAKALTRLGLTGDKIELCTELSTEPVNRCGLVGIRFQGWLGNLAVVADHRDLRGWQADKSEVK
jgi:hypothetical protein